uniref:NAD-dependent epimerase/dehydratase domain-containing protein n=1 Tax=Physcomitrium patens TaxID=3218 RepID=A9SH94_PHYPA
MALSQFEILHCCIRADDAQLKGLGFCGVKERGALMTTEHSSTPTMSAFIIGGTGMVGRKLVAELSQSDHFSRIVTLGRRVVAYDGPGKEKLDQHVVDFGKIEEHKALLENLDVGFNTLGTTRADAGSDEQFIKIDHDIPLHVARLFKEANPSKPLHFCLLSSSGASASSSLLYPKTKGLIEQHISELGFAKLSIFQPGILVYDGEKREKTRFAESIAVSLHKPLNFLTGGRAASGVTSVAKAIRMVAEKGITPGSPVDFYDNKSIGKLASGN